MGLTGTTPTEKSRRISGDERRMLTTRVATRYAAGVSIRALAVDIGRSYGLVHRLLAEAGVELRQRGNSPLRNRHPQLTEAGEGTQDANTVAPSRAGSIRAID